MNFRFLIPLLKRTKGRTPVFSSALEQGITDTFKEMGYSPGKMGKGHDENKTRDRNSKNNGQETFKKADSMKQDLFVSWSCHTIINIKKQIKLFIQANHVMEKLKKLFLVIVRVSTQKRTVPAEPVVVINSGSFPSCRNSMRYRKSG